jgi:hypothetical protein
MLCESGSQTFRKHVVQKPKGEVANKDAGGVYRLGKEKGLEGGSGQAAEGLEDPSSTRGKTRKTCDAVGDCTQCA